MKFADKIRQLRKAKNLTQTELADLCGLSLRTIRNYEIDERYPRQRSIYAQLAQALDCDVNYLLAENETFTLKFESADQSLSAIRAEQLVAELTGIFAAGETAEEDIDAMMLAIQEAYVDAKKRNRKFTRRQD